MVKMVKTANKVLKVTGVKRENVDYAGVKDPQVRRVNGVKRGVRVHLGQKGPRALRVKKEKLVKRAKKGIVV
jgi:hypothetical protein